MGRVVIACYRPKPNKQAELEALMQTHVKRLRAEGLVTERRPILMRSADGTFVEVFEWKSQQAIDEAHKNPAVLQMWGEYEAVCDYLPVAQVPEASQLFSDFAPVECD